MKKVIACAVAMLGIYACGGEEDATPALKPVTAAFSISKSKVNTGEEVTFTSTGNTNVVSWQWTFEGATPASSTAQNPKVVYNSSGTYDVQLIVKSENDADTLKMAKKITVLPGSGLVSFYQLDNASGTDIIGGHNAVLTGATAVSDHRGQANSAVQMADNGTIEFHDFDINKDYTYTFWYKKENSGNAWDRFMAKRSDCGNSKFTEMYANAGASNYSINFEYNTGTGSVFMNGSNVNYGTWVHVAVVYQSRQFKLYVNGSAIASSAALPEGTTFTNTYKLGFANTACYGTGTRVRGASVNNFRFYSKALSESDISILYLYE